jgi:hypothetical protein
MARRNFATIEPRILYFGTPVALISSLNEDGSTNLAPMSSFWALGWTLMLGLLDETKTAENFRAPRRVRHQSPKINPNQIGEKGCFWEEGQLTQALLGNPSL